MGRAGQTDDAAVNDSDKIDALAREIFALRAEMDAQRHASFVTDLATITILIDAGASNEATCQRLEHILSVMPEHLQSEGVRLRIEVLTEWLRCHQAPDQPGWTPVVIPGGLSAD